MLTDICLVIIAVSLVSCIAVLVMFFLLARQSVRFLQHDLHGVMAETTRLANTLNEFVQTDLGLLSKQVTVLAANLNDLSTDINNKSHSLNFLFKPLDFINSKLDSDSATGESSSLKGTIPQALKWLASSAVLFKTTKEFINNYGKQK